jgi:hypothetical protein
MDELVKNTAVVDGALVRAVTSLMPGESIEKILDATRDVNLKRVLNSVKARGYETVIHLVDDLHADGLSDEDIKTVLVWTGDPEAKVLVDSGLVNSVLKFVSEPTDSTPRPGCCIRHLRWWSKNK